MRKKYRIVISHGESPLYLTKQFYHDSLIVSPDPKKAMVMGFKELQQVVKTLFSTPSFVGELIDWTFLIEEVLQ